MHLCPIFYYFYRLVEPHFKSKAELIRPLRSQFVNASAVALLSFLFLLNLTQVCNLYCIKIHIFFRRLVLASTASEAIVDLYPMNGGYSVMGVDADSAVGLLGLLLFINLLRVNFTKILLLQKMKQKKQKCINKLI